MFHNKKVSIVLPAYNEEKSIAGAINDFFATGFVDEVIAVDNNSSDHTAAEIRKTKARYVRESQQGYGHALMRGMREVAGDLIITCESEGTFSPNDLEKFLTYSRDFEAVFGTRTSRAAIWSGAFMPFSVRLGNLVVAKFLEILHNGPSFSDVGCTYKLFSRPSYEKIKDLFRYSNGDNRFSPEIMIWTIRRGIKPIEIPVIYKPRIGQSKITGSVWRAALLGLRMVVLIFNYRFKRI